MLSRAFRLLCRPDAPQLVPSGLEESMEAEQAALYNAVLNGVYKVGINRLKSNHEAAAAAASVLYAALEGIEEKLASRRFLLGTPHPTAIDIRLTMTMLRFDIAYRQGFGLRGGRGGVLVGEGPSSSEAGYSNIGAYVRDVYTYIGGTFTAEDWNAYLQYYRWATGLPADQPLPDVARVYAAVKVPHERARLP